MPGHEAGRVPRVVLGVGGGIAAYKVPEVLRGLSGRGCEVRVVPTEAALRFVGATTWEALSGRPVVTSVWPAADEVRHVRVGQQADLVVVAPATADLLARAAAGMADDLLTTTLLTVRCPVMFVPAMHTEMWENPATRANVATLRERGYVVVEPATGRLTGSDTGKGRLPEPEEILDLVDVVLDRGPAALAADLSGLRVVVSAGGTREAIDPVRFLGNRSSGRQGMALALVAAARGASVTLVAANLAGSAPMGVDVRPVVSARDLRTAVTDAARDADVVVMAAAVADFRPGTYQDFKIKKTAGPPPTISLTPNPDVLLDLVGMRASGELAAGTVIVGFAAETGDDSGTVLDLGLEKLRRKGCDLLVVNPVGAGLGFEAADNEAVVLGRDGSSTTVARGPKPAVAAAVWDSALEWRRRHAGSSVR